jgi:predicted aminopeptidase
VSEAIGSAGTPEPVKDRLRDLDSIISFARSCGLTPGDSYKRYIDNGDRPLSWLIYAAKSDRLDPVTWWFPMVGRVPYLGFFEKSDRDAKEAELKAEGFDTARGSASAYSFLGFLPDPVYRSMTRRSREEFAHLIFHELVHRTVWVKGSASFNERLAEVLARRLTVSWLEDRKDARALDAYLVDLEDVRLFGVWLKSLRNDLEGLYSSGLDRETIIARKAEVLTSFTTSRKPVFKGIDRISGRSWNNAEVLASALYDASDFNCPLVSADPVKMKAFMDWLQKNRDRSIANDSTLEKACI